MKIEDYGLIFVIQHSMQSATPRARTTHHYKSIVINKTSFDFNGMEAKYHGEKLFSLTYNKKNYFGISCSGLNDSCWIKFPRGPTDYQPWFMGIIKEIHPYLQNRKHAKSLKLIIAEIEKDKPLPNIIIEEKIDFDGGIGMIKR